MATGIPAKGPFDDATNKSVIKLLPRKPPAVKERPGDRRDPEEFDALFAASGWRRDKTYPVGGGYSGLELEAV